MSSPDRTHYDVLGISRDADAAEIRAAWKLHVQVWHPDRFTGEMRERAEAQAARINEAYTTLRDSSRRAAYDCRLAADEEAQAAASAPPTAPRGRAGRTAVPERGAATPIGTPMAMAAPAPQTLGEQLAQGVRDLLDVVRLHPRVTMAACIALLLVFGSSIVLHAVNGPTLPSGAVSASGAKLVSSSDSGPSEDDLEDLAELTTQMRAEAAAADAQLQQMLREDALLAEREAKAAAAAAAATPRRDPRAGAGAAPKVPGPKRARPDAEAPGEATPPGGRIVRVMPRNR